uniref:NADH dehydrogenase subunit 4L n=1 Tax=Tapinoma ibericum TaxID=2005328 RepID=UPI002176BBF7|nr:NADH dehydrogenase subunit 4L [Tapinoma ibericum]UUF93601.1 NADH dehydrogenase subunit 4L [Tapinoma ibericum]
MFYDVMLYIQFFMMSLILLVLSYKYILLMLMILEIMILNISMVMFLMFSILKIEFYLIYYLVFSVCESVLGVSLLVLIVRYSGNDLYYSYNIGKI